MTATDHPGQQAIRDTLGEDPYDPHDPAHGEYDKVAAGLLAVLDLHHPVEWRWPVVDNQGQRQHEIGIACAECTGQDEQPRPYPCDTVKIVATAVHVDIPRDLNG